MARFVENLKIGTFRGMRDLTIPHLNHINIIAGDNNCGKTTLLEALLLLRDPTYFPNVLRVARERENMNSFYRSLPYDRLISLFPSSNDVAAAKEISIQGNCHGKDVSIRLHGDIRDVMIDEEELNVGIVAPSPRRKSEPLECKAFHGELLWAIGDDRATVDVKVNEYSRVTGTAISANPQLKMVYLSPFAHLQGGIYSRILKNEEYKKLCIDVLNLFDPGIEDILYLKNEASSRPIECVKHRDTGIMLLSSYGDGIKKVLSIANGIAQAVNGVLLIDEVETAIHAKYYEKIFRFIVSACKSFGVQLFVTSHSIEAIDGFLTTQDYDNRLDENGDLLSVITLKREGQKTYARVLDGAHVYQNRESFGFEVRL